MEDVTDMFACPRSTGANFAVALVCVFPTVIVLFAAKELPTYLIGFLLFCLTVWRSIVWVIDFASCF